MEEHHDHNDEEEHPSSPTKRRSKPNAEHDLRSPSRDVSSPQKGGESNQPRKTSPRTIQPRGQRDRLLSRNRETALSLMDEQEEATTTSGARDTSGNRSRNIAPPSTTNTTTNSRAPSGSLSQWELDQQAKSRAMGVQRKNSRSSMAEAARVRRQGSTASSASSAGSLSQWELDQQAKSRAMGVQRKNSRSSMVEAARVRRQGSTASSASSGSSLSQFEMDQQAKSRAMGIQRKNSRSPHSSMMARKTARGLESTEERVRAKMKAASTKNLRESDTASSRPGAQWTPSVESDDDDDDSDNVSSNLSQWEQDRQAKSRAMGMERKNSRSSHTIGSERNLAATDELIRAKVRASSLRRPDSTASRPGAQWTPSGESDDDDDDNATTATSATQWEQEQQAKAKAKGVVRKNSRSPHSSMVRAARGLESTEELVRAKMRASTNQAVSRPGAQWTSSAETSDDDDDDNATTATSATQWEQDQQAKSRAMGRERKNSRSPHSSMVRAARGLESTEELVRAKMRASTNQAASRPGAQSETSDDDDDNATTATSSTQWEQDQQAKARAMGVERKNSRSSMARAASGLESTEELVRAKMRASTNQQQPDGVASRPGAQWTPSAECDDDDDNRTATLSQWEQDQEAKSTAMGIERQNSLPKPSTSSHDDSRHANGRRSLNDTEDLVRAKIEANSPMRVSNSVTDDPPPSRQRVKSKASEQKASEQIERDLEIKRRAKEWRGAGKNADRRREMRRQKSLEKVNQNLEQRPSYRRKRSSSTNSMGDEYTDDGDKSDGSMSRGSRNSMTRSASASSQSSLHQMEEDVEAKARSRQTSRRLSRREMSSSRSPVNLDLESRRRALQSSLSVGNMNRSNHSQMADMENEIEAKARGGHIRIDNRGVLNRSTSQRTAVAGATALQMMEDDIRGKPDPSEDGSQGRHTVEELDELEAHISSKNFAYMSTSIQSMHSSFVSEKTDEEEDNMPLGAFNITAAGDVTTRGPGTLSMQPLRMRMTGRSTQDIAYNPENSESSQSESEADAEVEEEMEEEIDMEMDLETEMEVEDDPVDAHVEALTASVTPLQSHLLGESSYMVPAELTTKEPRTFFTRWCIAIMVGICIVAGGGVGLLIWKMKGDGNQKSDDARTTEEDDLMDVDTTEIALLLEKFAPRSAVSLQDRESPQHLAAVWCLEDPFSAGAFGAEAADEETITKFLTRFSLATFFYGLSGTKWFSASNWLAADQEECAWEYITCNNMTQVVSIDTQEGGNLQGQIPMEISYLKSLEKLQLRDNIITGLSELNANLEILDLSRNELQTSIPVGLFTLTHLTMLALGDNELTGWMDSSLDQLTLLEILRLENNNLSGLFPNDLVLLKSLRELDISGNRIGGSFDETFPDLIALESLSINDNNFEGSLSTTIGNLKNLSELKVSGNNISGELPNALFELQRLSSLQCSRNQMTGTLPTLLGDLSALDLLYLDQNRFQGNIPTELGNLQSMAELTLANNQISGTIPTELGNAASLSFLAIQLNFMDGGIPSEIGLCTNLARIDMFRNDFTGTIPAEFGELNRLQSLRLDGNSGLQGSIPEDICDAHSLELIRAPCDVTCSCNACGPCS